MVNERVVEAVEDILSELFEFCLREVECLHEFFEHYLVDELPYDWVLACVADDVDAGEVSDRGEDSVRSVEEGHFSFMVRSFRRNEEDVESGLVSREFLSYFLWSLDYPEVEDFSLDYEVVAILQLFLDSCDVFARESRNDSVYEGCIDSASLFEPSLEVVTEFPEFDVLIDSLFELMSIEEDEFAREDYKSFREVSAEGLVAAIEELRELSRIGRCWCVFEFAGWVEIDACFCCVGDDEADVRSVCERHEFFVLGVRIESSADDVNHRQAVDSLAFFKSLQVNMIEVILSVEHVNHSSVDWLNDNDAAVEVCLLVHVPDYPVNECAEEVAFSELDDSLGTNCFSCSFFV